MYAWVRRLSENRTSSSTPAPPTPPQKKGQVTQNREWAPRRVGTRSESRSCSAAGEAPSAHGGNGEGGAAEPPPQGSALVKTATVVTVPKTRAPPSRTNTRRTAKLAVSPTRTCAIPRGRGAHLAQIRQNRRGNARARDLALSAARAHRVVVV